MDVGAGLVYTCEVEPGAQRGTGYESVPPVPTYVSQHDQVLILAVFAIVVRDKGENFRRNPIYGRERVPYGPEQSEHFKYVSFTWKPHVSDDVQRQFLLRFASPQTDLWPSQSCRRSRILEN